MISMEEWFGMKGIASRIQASGVTTLDIDTSTRW